MRTQQTRKSVVERRDRPSPGYGPPNQSIDFLDRLNLRPNNNAHLTSPYLARIKELCLERTILFGEQSLRTALHNFVRTAILNAITKASPTGSSARKLVTSAMPVR